MIERIKALILGAAPATGGGGHGPGKAVKDEEVAAVALLVEAAVMDGAFDDDERRTIARLIAGRFGIDGADVDALIAVGEQAVADSNQLYAFTSVVKEGFDFAQRIEMVEMLWEVAYADGVLHDYEASLVRRVAGLIHVTDRDSGTARKKVLNRLGLSGAAP